MGIRNTTRVMHLIEILLPLYDNDGQPFASANFDQVRRELTEAFGGVAALRRAPAEGIWKDSDGDMSRDEIVIFEVMAEEADRQWWANYRQELERRFRQERIVVRATKIALL